MNEWLNGWNEWMNGSNIGRKKENKNN